MRRSAVQLFLVSLLASVCTAVGAGGAASGANRASSSHGATYALQTGEVFSWMLPLENEVNYQVYDANIELGMWLPLYAAGKGSKTGIDYGRSIGKPPVYSDGNKTVTVTLRTGFSWSDGTKVTTADIKFFFELFTAGKTTLGEYIPGEMPDDIKSVTYPTPYQFVLHLKRAYNPLWFTGDQLTWIIPLPAQAWDKTCTTCPVGNTATTASGAKKVFDYLFGQSKRLRTYSTNPLWKTVDGPWIIRTYSPITHDATFARNTAYTGPTTPQLASYKVDSFATGTAELDALRSGSVTFGYVPLSDLKEVDYFKGHGFTVKPWKFFYNEAIEFGYTSKTWGPLVQQLYIRQALEHLITQTLYITRTLGGYGLPDYGPVANYPNSKYVSSAIRKNFYPYNPHTAAKLLKTHGWVEGPNGIDVCKHPGTSPHDCGKGIPKNKQLSFLFYYETGTTSFFAQVSGFQSAAKKVGIGITLQGQTLTTMYSVAGVCPNTGPCKWGLAGYAGYLWPYSYNTIVPTGKNEFGLGNFWAGGYSDSKAQSLITAADHGAGVKPLYRVEKYLAKDVASLWWPLEDEVVVVRKNLKGWEHLSPYGTIVPSRWHVSK